jgi:hypothetical protein
VSPKWSLSLRFPHQNPVYASPLLIRATGPAHLILVNFTTRTILGEQYRSLSYSLCSFLQSPVTSSLLGTNILLNINIRHSQPTFLPQYERPSFTPTQSNTRNCYVYNIRYSAMFISICLFQLHLESS